MEKAFVDVSHLLVIEFTKEIGDTIVEYVGLVNKEALSAETAFRLISAEEYNPHILTMTKSQWKSIFKQTH